MRLIFLISTVRCEYSCYISRRWKYNGQFHWLAIWGYFDLHRSTTKDGHSLFAYFTKRSWLTFKCKCKFIATTGAFHTSLQPVSPAAVSVNSLNFLRHIKRQQQASFNWQCYSLEQFSMNCVLDQAHEMSLPLVCHFVSARARGTCTRESLKLKDTSKSQVP